MFTLMDLAAAHGLSGVEVPPEEYLRDRSPEALSRVRAYARERGLFIVLDTGVVDSKELERLIPVAKNLGVRTHPRHSQHDPLRGAQPRPRDLATIHVRDRQ